MAALSPQLFVLLGSLVEERCGLHYGPREEAIFAEKVTSRMAEAGFESPLDYYYYLRYDPGGPEELSALVDALVVGETYLFRELDALRAAMAHAIRPAIAAHGVARVWSAGCSTGEEPFTLAMMCVNEGILPQVEIVATDVSQRSLGRALAGKLSIRALRALEGNPWAREISEPWVKDGRMSPTIIGAIDFRRESLIDPKMPPLRNNLDLILCRNVLIYFRDEVVRTVVNTLAGCLRPGGRLLVGASESLLRFGTLLRCEERGGAFFYVKP